MEKWDAHFFDFTGMLVGSLIDGGVHKTTLV